VTKTLLICRHSKSSWDDVTLSDHDRPLNQHGRRNAPEMGRRLRRLGIQPDLLLVSTAVRTRKTAQHYMEQLGCPLERLLLHPEIYAATVSGLLGLVRKVDSAVRTLLLVGHNPECTGLANLLGSLHLDRVPTSGIVALRFPVDRWEEITPGAGELLFYDFPKNRKPGAGE
jgi:phosphohistidine phosphatase